jgi:hypothetical protein
MVLMNIIFKNFKLSLSLATFYFFYLFFLKYHRFFVFVTLCWGKLSSLLKRRE